MQQKINGFLALLGTALIFGIYPYFMRTLSSMYSSYSQILFRALVAFIILLVIFLFNKEKLTAPKNKLINLIVFSTMIPITSILTVISINQIKASTTIFMLYAGSLIFSFLIGTFIYKESITKSKTFAISAVVIGLVFFAFPFDFASKTGILIGFCAGIAEGIGNGIRKTLREIPRNTILFYQFGISILLTILALTITQQPVIKEYTLFSIGITIIYGASSLLIGYLLIYGFNHFDANIGTTIISSEMFFSIIFSLILLGEKPSLQELFGGLLIFIGANIPNLLYALSERRKGIAANSQTTLRR